MPPSADNTTAPTDAGLLQQAGAALVDGRLDDADGLLARVGPDGRRMPLFWTTFAALTAERGRAFTAPELAAKAGAPEAAEIAFKVLEHLSANPATGVRRRAGATATAAKYRLA